MCKRYNLSVRDLHTDTNVTLDYVAQYLSNPLIAHLRFTLDLAEEMLWADLEWKKCEDEMKVLSKHHPNLYFCLTLQTDGTCSSVERYFRGQLYVENSTETNLIPKRTNGFVLFCLDTLCAQDLTDTALDLLFEYLDVLMDNGDFATIDDLMKFSKTLNPTVLTGVLTITQPIKDRLRVRPEIEQHLLTILSPEDLKGLLST